MKRFFRVVCVILALVCIAPTANAAEESPIRPETQTVGAHGGDMQSVKTYFPTAKTLGMDWASFVAVTSDRTQMTIEYLPQGQTSQNWTRMMSVVLTPVGADFVAAAPAMAHIIDNMKRVVQESGATIKTFDLLIPPNAENVPPRAFFHYTLKEEENVGIILFDTAGFCAIIQSQARKGAHVPPSDIAFLRRMAEAL